MQLGIKALIFIFLKCDEIFLFFLRVRFFVLWRQAIEFGNTTFLPVGLCHKSVHGSTSSPRTDENQ